MARSSNSVDAYAQAVASGKVPAGKMATVYALCDSREADPVLRVRYIGKTTSLLSQRLNRHKYSARVGRTFAVAAWIRAVVSGGGIVLIEPLASLSVDESDEAEKRHIAAARKRGCDLLNLTAGGKGMVGFQPSDVTRRKLSAMASRRKLSDEQKRKIGLAMTGRVVSDVTRQKLSDRHRGDKSIVAKLTWNNVAVIRARHDSGESQRQLSLEFGVAWSTIYKIVHNQTWRETL